MSVKVRLRRPPAYEETDLQWQDDEWGALNRRLVRESCWLYRETVRDTCAARADKIRRVIVTWPDSDPDKAVLLALALVFDRAGREGLTVVIE